MAVITLSSVLCEGSNLKTDDIFLIKKTILENKSNDTLIGFDVNDVLIMPTEDYYFNDPIRKKIVKEQKKRLSKEQYELLQSKLLDQRKVMLVDTGIPELFREIHAQKFPILAISKWWTGSLGHVSHMEDLRFRELDSVGLSFKELCQFQKEIRFPKLDIGRGVPLLQNCVVMTSFADKADVLKNLLAQSGKKYSTFVFVDDDPANLITLEKLSQTLKMKFIGIEFTAAKNRKLTHPLNEEVERTRFSIFEKEGKYLSSEELMQRINVKQKQK